MRYELRSIGIWAFVRVSFFLHLVVGFLVGLFYAAMLMMIFAAASSGPFEGMSDLPFDPGAVGPFLIIILPVALAFGSAVMGTLFCVVIIAAYNLIVRMVGGIEFELEPAALQGSGTSVAPISRPEDRPYIVPPPPPPGPPGPGAVSPAPPPAYVWTPPPPPPSNSPGRDHPENP